jgi:hypothetical protein
MSQSLFRRIAIAFAVLAYGVSAVILWRVTGAVAPGAVFALWSTFPVFWWLRWALHLTDPSPAHQRAILIVGAVLAVAFVLFHLLAWSAVNSSSTGGFAYITIPFFLLIGTVVAISIGNSQTRDPA